MPTIIEVDGNRATLKDWEWESDDHQLAVLLNSMLPDLGPSGADPNPAATAAEEAVEELGGRVVSVDEVEAVAGEVY